MSLHTSLRSILFNKSRTRSVIAAFVILGCLWLGWPFLFGEREEDVNYRNVMNMAVEGDEFWLASARDQGLSSSDATVHAAKKETCGDFFVVWPGDCVESHGYLTERMRTLSAQMIVMNSTVHFFTTDLTRCDWDKYSGVTVRLFNATEELVTHGFGPLLPIIDSWDKTRFTRLSDILRLCLAYRHQLSYIDTDVHFLQLQRSLYLQPYVGAQLWSDKKNAIEITNAAWCLPRNVLKDMMGYQMSVIRRKKEGKKILYFYTELGPSMFHHVLFNRHAIPFYSQNHPAEPSLNRIAKEIHQYGHKQLHLTGRIRKGNKGLSFDQLCNMIRKKSGLPELNILPPALPSIPTSHLWNDDIPPTMKLSPTRL